MTFPPSVKSGADHYASDSKSSPYEKVDDIVVPQIDRRKDESTDEREKEVE
jgi:hypothetical protein